MAGNMKFFMILIPLLFSLSCANTTVKKVAPVAIKKNIGWMHGNCLAIENIAIKIPTVITLVRLEEKNMIENATVIAKTHQQEACFPLMDDRRKINISNGYSFYLIDSVTPVDLAIAVIDAKSLNPSDFSYCSTTEGIKYVVENNSGVIWEGYYYLGYDSEVTCKSNH